MSTVTTLLGLTKPAGIEQFSLSTYNNNLDLIDTHAANAILKNRPFGHMGRTAGFAALQGIGTMTNVIMDAAQQLAGGMTFSDADDALIIPVSGWYRVYIKGFFTGGSSGINQAGIKINGAATGGPGQAAQFSVNKMDGNDVYHHSSGRVQFNAGDKIALWEMSVTTVSYWGTNGYDGAWLELEYTGS